MFKKPTYKAGTLNDKMQNLECSICLDNPVNTIVIPCGHLCMCWGCAETILSGSQQCPICRRHVRAVNRVYITGREASGDATGAAAAAPAAAAPAEEPPVADGSLVPLIYSDSSDDEVGETKEDQFDRKFIIRNNIRAFAAIGTRGVGDAIVDSIRDIHQFNWVKNGLTGNFESTLSSATRWDVQHIRQRLQEKGLLLQLINDTGDTKVYEIKGKIYK